MMLKYAIALLGGDVEPAARAWEHAGGQGR